MASVQLQLYGVNGRVNRTQLYQTLQNLVRISQKELNSIFLQADPDNLGTIDYSMVQSDGRQPLKPRTNELNPFLLCRSSAGQFVKAIERNPLLAKLQKNNDPNNLRLG